MSYKVIMKKNKNIYTPSKWIYIIMFIIPLFAILLRFISSGLDNDTWYLLSEGRYILKHGIYHIDPLSFHKGLHVVVQNYLSAVFMWIIYDSFGKIGLATLVLLCNTLICFLLYKISLTISNNKLLSLFTMFVTDITLSSYYIVTRPQIFSFIILLTVIYVLELYIKTNNYKYLMWLPILSLIEINIHASLWWMIFLFILPYLIDSFKSTYLNTQGYPKKPLLIFSFLAFLMGFINPYGCKAITFIFTSYGDKIMHTFISELLPYSFASSTLSIHMYFLVLITSLTFVYFREGKIRIRYICLYIGTLLLGLMSTKGFSHFILVSIFPISYFFSDMFPNDLSDVSENVKKISSKIYMIVSILCIIFFIIFYGISFKKIKFENHLDEIINIIARYSKPEKVKIYSSFNDGGQVEFRGYKPYIDPRAELFLKVNNKKDDIFEEFYNLQTNKLNIKDFLNKYNFDYIIARYNDPINKSNLESNGYFVLYNNSKTQYMLYAINNLFSEEKRNEIIKAYEDANEKSKKDKDIK